MVDYVAVVASIPSFSEVYPSITTLRSIQSIPDSSYNYAFTGDLYAQYVVGTFSPECNGYSIVAFKMLKYEGVFYDDYEVCYYIMFPAGLNNGASDFQSSDIGLWRCTSSDVSSMSFHNPFGDPAVENPGGVYWLYYWGDYLLNGFFLVDLLNYEVGNTNLFSLIITSGFLVYMGWALLKWVIP